VSPKTVVLGLTLVALTLAGPFAGMAMADHTHSNHELHCGHCHVMHATRNDGLTKYNSGAGYDHLLLAGSITETCLTCHNGSTYTDVVGAGLSTEMIPASGGQNSEFTTDPYGASGGFFCADYKTASSKFGHDLFASGPVTAIQGSWVSDGSGMTCGDCHEVHGNHNYRNLKLQPGNGGSNINITYNETGADVQIDPAKTGRNARRTDAIAFNAGNDLSNWCLDCHSDIDSSSTTKHPVNRSLSDAAGNGTVDAANWAKGVSGGGWGFGNTVDDAYGATEYGVPRVRFAQSGDTFSACTTVHADNDVMCLTCHKAHGSKYDSAQCWPYQRYSAVTPNPAYSPIDRAAACQQCHNRGVHD